MRRLSSIFLTTAALIAGFLTTSGAVSAATSGVATKTTSAAVSPAAVPNATIVRTARLTKSDGFLVVGVDKATSGAHMFLWKMKNDLTIDSSLTPIDLGAEFSFPTNANSSCSNYCFNMGRLVVNENLGAFTFSINRQLNGSGTSSNMQANVATIVTGKISSNATLSKLTSVSAPNASTAADWSTYGTDLTSSRCTSEFGTNYQGVSLISGNLNTYSIIMRPDGSLVYGITCRWAPASSGGGNSALKEYNTELLVGVKPSGTTLIADTSWGTNGVVKTFDDPTKCAYVYPSFTYDTSITSNTSTKLFTILQKTSSPRVTTYPWGNMPPGFTSYDGCGNMGPSATGATDSYLLLEADGSAKPALTSSVVSQFAGGSWIIDSAGRWNSMVNSGTPMAAKYSLLRITPKGEFDTTLGTNGMKEFSNLPSTLSINGTTVSMRYNISGIANTATSFYFTGFASSSANSSCNNLSTTASLTLFPYYLSVENGLLTTYGTGGLGEGVKADYLNEECFYSSNLTYINAKGQHAMFRQVKALGSQAAGFLSATWDTTDGIISGGDGVGVAGASGRTDTKVYSKTLPKKVEDDTALTVLTAKQAKDLDLRSTTPKVCVALTTSVLMLNPGKCTVQVIDEDTKKVLRTMRTTVATTDQEIGSTLTTDEPIKFKQADTTLSKKALEQIAAIAEAAGSAKKVVVIGHSAALGEVSTFSYAISRDRANAVKAALIKAGVKASIIETVALSYGQPLSTKKSESAQAKNRRAEVFILE